MTTRATCSGVPTKGDGTPALRVVIRRLPPSMTEEALLKEMGPSPGMEHFYFTRTNGSIAQPVFCRAYVKFQREEDVMSFRQHFDGRAFFGDDGREYRAVVERAPRQAIPRESLRQDPLAGTAQHSRGYAAFLAHRAEEGKRVEPLGTALEYFPSKKERTSSTPLLDYLRERRGEPSRQANTLVRTPTMVSAKTAGIVPDCLREKSGGQKKLFNYRASPPKPKEEQPIRSAADEDRFLEAELKRLLDDDEDIPGRKPDALGRKKCKFVPISTRSELTSLFQPRLPQHRRLNVILGDFFVPNLAERRRSDGATTSMSCSSAFSRVVKSISLDHTLVPGGINGTLKLLVREPGPSREVVKQKTPRLFNYSNKLGYASD